MRRRQGSEHDPPTAPLPTGSRVRETYPPASPPVSDTGPRGIDPYSDPDPYGVPGPNRGELPAQAGPPPTEHRYRPPRPDARRGVMLAPLLIGGAVALAIGVYGRAHDPTGYAVNLAGFSSAGYVKAWLGTIAVLLALVQIVSAKLMYGPSAASWVPGVHRWSGRLAVLVSVPVAMHCLYGLGFQTDSPRVWVHSLAGCLFYGAFTAKMLSLSREGTPRWAVPMLGGLVFTVLVVLWLTSAFWLFGRQGVHL